MRSNTLVICALGALAGCAAPLAGRTCNTVSSWASPAVHCEPNPVAAPPPEAPPVAAPEPAPAPPPARVEVKAEQIELREKVLFANDKADIADSSKPLLDEVVKVMQDHPEVTKVQVEGYTDSTATRDHNQRLSEERAAAVKSYLVGHGIAAGRLVSKGFGEDKPIGDNATEEGRSANRRVELHILERKK